MEPTDVQDFLDSMAQELFGRSMREPCCVACGSGLIRVGDFRDALSRREFFISHLCQACQDLIYEKEE